MDHLTTRQLLEELARRGQIYPDVRFGEPLRIYSERMIRLLSPAALEFKPPRPDWADLLEADRNWRSSRTDETGGGLGDALG